MPLSADDFRDGLEEIYHLKRRSEMEHLRYVWECGGWLSNALDTAKSNGWNVGEIIESLRDDKRVPFGWKRSSVYSYAQLSREEWRDVAKCGSIGKALEWLRAKRRTPQAAAAMKERKARSRNRDAVYRSRMLHMEREIDALTKRNRQLEERNRVLEAEANPATVLDLEAVIRDHAEAERLAHVMTAAAEMRAEMWERRVERVEKAAAHLRLSDDKRRSDPLSSISIGREHVRTPEIVAPEVAAVDLWQGVTVSPAGRAA